MFALNILARKEGLVLKPDEPYFDFTDQRRKYSSCCIKLKKEYIGKFGDVGDFAVVGARYDAKNAMSYRIPGLKWTHFYIGCLDNREAVRSWKAKPEFTIVNVVELNETLLKEVVIYSNPEPVDPGENEAIILKQAPGVEQGLPPTAVFTKPLVFDLRCFSFDRVGNTGFWSLRFPSVTKVHFDRDFTDTMSFEQLQTLAKDATTASELEDSQDNLQWIAKLEAADPRGVAVDAASQLTVTTMPTPSPRKSTQNTTSTWSPTSPTTARALAGNQISTCRDRLERLHPLILPTSAAAISMPAAPAASPTEHRSKQKPDPLISQSQPPRKRLKLDTESPPKHKHLLGSVSDFEPREPLIGIDGYMRSQPTMATCFVCSDDVDSDDYGALGMIIATNPEQNLRPQPASVACASPSSACSDEPDFDDEVELQTETEPRRQKIGKKLVDVALMDGGNGSGNGNGNGNGIDDDDSNDDGSTPRERCVYAGEKCAFAKAVVLISPGLLADLQVKRVFRLHGIDHPIEEIDAWLEKEKSGKLRKTGKLNTDIYLLCQSNDKVEAKSLFDKIQKAREAVQCEQQEMSFHHQENWIHAYDWRVLEHVTIQEDESIYPKDYDGFCTPWERWRIGPGLI
ncbi:DNA ligase 4 [Fusarium longipes]|uniref:DNA ligase 4 n=1 Tax=Fusarium longipes TaxID=694270 RepID=A0A395S9E6_9HYPO|nr:DNA ligase 4 [Fusarium longipes]